MSERLSFYKSCRFTRLLADTNEAGGSLLYLLLARRGPTLDQVLYWFGGETVVDQTRGEKGESVLSFASLG
jgi:hypothetical protein